MTLDEAKEMLSANNISFELCEFESEKEYWLHAMLFPHTKNARSCKVIALLIRSENGKTNIELQFNMIGDSFFFEELWFGEYSYDMYDSDHEMITGDLLHNISKTMRGKLTVIVVNDLKKRCWRADCCFDRGNDEGIFGEHGFLKTMERIRRPKGFLSKLSGTKKQYEIFDWNTYQCIVK